MGALTVRLLENIARYELGATPETPIEIRELVNQAGEALVSAYPWRWLSGRAAHIRPRASITIEDATWTEATLRLTLTGAFADYTWLQGDTFSCTDGTGATAGTYEVVARVDDDSITLCTSIGAAADGQTDITGSLPNDQVVLPQDFSFQSIEAYGMTNGLLGMVAFTDAQEMLDVRQWLPSGGISIGFWALVRWVRAPSGGAAIPRIELHPTTTSSDEQITLFYRGGWTEPTDDGEALCLPVNPDGTGGWLNAFFIEIFKVFVMGNEESELGSLSVRLAQLLTRGGDGMPLNPLFRQAVTRDALIQPDYGLIRNGWLETRIPPESRYDLQPFRPVTF